VAHTIERQQPSGPCCFIFTLGFTWYICYAGDVDIPPVRFACWLRWALDHINAWNGHPAITLAIAILRYRLHIDVIIRRTLVYGASASLGLAPSAAWCCSSLWSPLPVSAVDGHTVISTLLIAALFIPAPPHPKRHRPALHRRSTTPRRPSLPSVPAAPGGRLERYRDSLLLWSDHPTGERDVVAVTAWSGKTHLSIWIISEIEDDLIKLLFAQLMHPL
jgi:hypothetical protein